MQSKREGENLRLQTDDKKRQGRGKILRRGERWRERGRQGRGSEEGYRAAERGKGNRWRKSFLYFGQRVKRLAVSSLSLYSILPVAFFFSFDTFSSQLSNLSVTYRALNPLQLPPCFRAAIGARAATDPKPGKLTPARKLTPSGSTRPTSNERSCPRMTGFAFRASTSPAFEISLITLSDRRACPDTR